MHVRACLSHTMPLAEHSGYMPLSVSTRQQCHALAAPSSHDFVIASHPLHGSHALSLAAPGAYLPCTPRRAPPRGPNSRTPKPARGSAQKLCKNAHPYQAEPGKHATRGRTKWGLTFQRKRSKVCGKMEQLNPRKYRNWREQEFYLRATRDPRMKVSLVRLKCLGQADLPSERRLLPSVNLAQLNFKV